MLFPLEFFYKKTRIVESNFVFHVFQVVFGVQDDPRTPEESTNTNPCFGKILFHPVKILVTNSNFLVLRFFRGAGIFGFPKALLERHRT